MTFKRDRSGDPPRRLSPSELAEEVARRLKSGSPSRGAHRRRPRFDIVTASRIAMALAVVLLAAGAVLAISWVGRLAGFETTGTVLTESAVYGCPGEPELGVLFSGETVELVGRSTDGAWFAVRDGRGPGNVVYAGADSIDPAGDFEQLATRSCDPRDADEVAAVDITNDPGTGSLVTTTVSTTSETTAPGTTSTVAGFTDGQPPQVDGPGTGGTSPTTTRPGSPAPSPTLPPGSTTTGPPTTAPAPTQPPSTGPTTTLPPGTTPTTQPSTTTTTALPTTTLAPSTTTTSTMPATSTTPPTTSTTTTP
ncbi:MAG: hypothetical protein ACRDZM_05075 [Acidimicrobiia bacterium]